MIKKTTISVVVALLLFGSAFQPVNAGEMTFSQMIELFISAGIIAPNKAVAARALAANSGIVIGSTQATVSATATTARTTGGGGGGGGRSVSIAPVAPIVAAVAAQSVSSETVAAEISTPVIASKNTKNAIFEDSFTAAIPTVVTEASTSTATSTFCGPLTRNLSVGSSGDDVVFLQTELGVQTVTGYFGSITEAAVNKFEADHGLAVVGYMHDKAIDVFNSIYGCNPDATRARPSILLVSESTITKMMAHSGTTTASIVGTTTVRATFMVQITATGSDFTFNKGGTTTSAFSSQGVSIYKNGGRINVPVTVNYDYIAGGVIYNSDGSFTLHQNNTVIFPVSFEFKPAGPETNYQISLDYVSWKSTHNFGFTTLYPNFSMKQWISPSIWAGGPSVDNSIFVGKGNDLSTTTLYAGQHLASIMPIVIKTGDSDMRIQRIRVDIGTSTAFYTKVFKGLYLVDENENVLVYSDLNSSTVVRQGSNYYVTLSGFDYFVPKSTSKNLTLRADLYSLIKSQDRISYDIRIPTNAVRGIDEVNVDQLAPMVDFTQTLLVQEHKSITLISPNGGEDLVRGQLYNITWSTIDIPAESKIYMILSSDSGQTFDIMEPTLNDGIETWIVPTFSKGGFEIKPGKYTIAICVLNSEGTICPEIYGGSISSFTISLPVFDSFHSADLNHNLKIDIDEMNMFVNLYNYRIGTVRTGDYQYLHASSYPYVPGFGSHYGPHNNADTNKDWKISLSELTRVIELKNASGGYRVQVGTEDGFAPVYETTVVDSRSSITITSPNGGENYKVGDTMQVTWNAINFATTSTVYLELRANGSTPLSSMSNPIVKIATTSPVSGYYNWQIPNAVVPGQYIVEVYRADMNGNIDPNEYVKDVSDSYFTISSSSPVTCTDSDGGVNLDVAGLTDGRVNGNGSYFTDISVATNGSMCSGGNCTSVAEGMCVNGALTNQLYMCPSGYSVGGVCAPQPQVSTSTPVIIFENSSGGNSVTSSVDNIQSPDVAEQPEITEIETVQVSEPTVEQVIEVIQESEIIPVVEIPTPEAVSEPEQTTETPVDTVVVVQEMSEMQE